VLHRAAKDAQRLLGQSRMMVDIRWSDDGQMTPMSLRVTDVERNLQYYQGAT